MQTIKILKPRKSPCSALAPFQICSLHVTARKYKKKKASDVHKNPMFAAMNEELDLGIGTVLDKLDELGLSNSTYVIYTSDNGFQEREGKEKFYGKAAPLYCAKGFVNEGGVRVPWIVRGPGIQPGSYVDARVISHDIFPTVMDIVGAKDKTPSVVEGGSLLPFLRHERDSSVMRLDDFFIFHYPHGLWIHETAILRGDYKLIFTLERKYWPADSVDGLSLFDLKKDVGESVNIASQHPKLTQTLYRILIGYLKRVHERWFVRPVD